MARRIRKLIRLFAFLVVISVALILAFRLRYQDAIRALAQTQVVNATSDLINDAIDHQIEKGVIQYDRIVFFE